MDFLTFAHRPILRKSQHKSIFGLTFHEGSRILCSGYNITRKFIGSFRQKIEGVTLQHSSVTFAEGQRQQAVAVLLMAG